MSNYLDFPSHAEMVEMYNVNFTNNDKLYESRDADKKNTNKLFMPIISSNHFLLKIIWHLKKLTRIGYETMMELTGGRF